MITGSLVYLFAAYVIIWVVLLAYVFFVSQQVGDLRAQLRTLRRDRSPGGPVDGKP